MPRLAGHKGTNVKQRPGRENRWHGTPYPFPLRPVRPLPQAFDANATTLLSKSQPHICWVSRMRAHLPLIVLALTITAFAGCLQADTEADVDTDSALGVVRDDWWVGVVPSSLLDENHDHGDRSMHHGLTTENFETLGWDPLVTDMHGTSLTGMGCGGATTRDDGRRLAVVHSISTVTSFVVADITDPVAPFMVGEFYLPNAVVWDATISDDGNHVLIGAYPPGPLFGRSVTPPVGTMSGTDLLGLDPTQLAYDHHGQPITADTFQAPAWAEGITSMIAFRDACTGTVVETGPANYLPGPAIVMAGIQTPENPVFEDYVPQPAIGPHSVGSQTVGGIQYATSSVTNLVHETSYYTFFEIADTPAGSKLVAQSVLQTPGINSNRQDGSIGTPAGPVPFPWLNGHTDVYLHEHPFTGQVLAYLANWDGMYVYDMTTPQTPVQIGVFLDDDNGSLHTTYPFPYTIDDKFYMVAAQEVGEPVDLPSGWVYLLDVTDPTNPTEVSRWTLPVKPKWDDGGLQFSPHYVAILDETLFVTNYHGGMWAVDISDLANPQAIGIFVPELDSTAPWRDGAYGPVVEDVIVDQDTGVVTTWDGAGGVYQLTWHADYATERAPHYDPADFAEQ